MRWGVARKIGVPGGGRRRGCEWREEEEEDEDGNGGEDEVGARRVHWRAKQTETTVKLVKSSMMAVLERGVGGTGRWALTLVENSHTALHIPVTVL